MTITYPLLVVVDDSGAVVTGATVSVASITDKAGSAISSPGYTLNAGADPFVSIDYDAEAKGEAILTLAISKVASTITGLNAAPRFYLARDSGRTLTALPAYAPAAANGLLTRGTGAGQVNPDGSGNVTAASVANLVGVLLDIGTVAASPSPTATTYSATGLTATTAGAYVGSQHVFQASSGLGHAHRVVTAHTITSGGTPVHNFTVTTPAGVTPTVGPAAGDTFLGG